MRRVSCGGRAPASRSRADGSLARRPPVTGRSCSCRKWPAPDRASGTATSRPRSARASMRSRPARRGRDRARAGRRARRAAPARRRACRRASAPGRGDRRAHHDVTEQHAVHPSMSVAVAPSIERERQDVGRAFVAHVLGVQGRRSRRDRRTSASAPRRALRREDARVGQRAHRSTSIVDVGPVSSAHDDAAASRRRWDSADQPRSRRTAGRSPSSRS